MSKHGGVKEVVVCAASRLEAKGFSSRGALESEIFKCKQERESLAEEQRQLQLHLGNLTVEVAGKRIDPVRFHQVCKEQRDGKVRLYEIQLRLRTLRIDLTELNSILESIRDGRGKMDDNRTLILKAIVQDLQAIKKHLGIT